MEPQNIKALLGKLNGTMAKALEAAAGTCIQRSHFEISVEHVLLKLMDNPRADISLIMAQKGVAPDEVRTSLDKALAQLKDGNFSKPKFSPILLECLNLGWNFGSLEREETKLRSGHFLVALLRDAAWFSGGSAPAFEAFKETEIVENFEALTEGGEEVLYAPRKAAKKGGATGVPEILDAFTVDLVAEALAEKIDPVLGRDHEIYQVIDILTRRRKNNPILVGEPGVGKSAIVEGMARLVAEEKVPPALAKVQIRTLDLGLLKAGASMKGEFEERLKNVIDAVQESPIPIILFIDEAHTLIGAGGPAGGGDAANLLKPALARGQLRTIAATTWSEYKKYIEKDPALERRFQLVKVDEPDVERASLMVRGLKDRYAQHHKVVILDSAVEAAAALSHKYLTDRQLPDKAIDLLDTSCARVKLSLESPPYEITRLENEIIALEREIEGKQHETSLTGKTIVTLEEAEAKKVACKQSLEALTKKWMDEKELVDEIVECERQLTDPELKDREAVIKTLAEKQAALAGVAGENPLVSYRVTRETVSAVVSQWTGIPVGNMVKNELDTIIQMESLLTKRVLGQDHVAGRIAKAVKASKARINNPDAPIGVFLAVGPSGTGKTEMALSIADLLFGGERFCIQINMSEYQEKHTVSRLIGSPPGYVGYGEGGVLSEAVRQRPYSVVLLDEVEKGHPDVMNLFYQVFDKGHLADGEGRIIDFKNTIIMMTSNLGSAIIEDMCEGKNEERPEVDGLLEAIRPTLNQYFKPALLARMTVLPYFPISEQIMKRIVGLKLHKVVKRLKQNHRIETGITANVIRSISDRCRLVEAGARNIDHIINGELLPLIADTLLEHLRDGTEMSKLTIDAEDNSFNLKFE